MVTAVDAVGTFPTIALVSYGRLNGYSVFFAAVGPFSASAINRDNGILSAFASRTKLRRLTLRFPRSPLLEGKFDRVGSPTTSR